LLPRRVEEQQLQDKMQAEHHEEGFDMDEASHRLNEIYERMQEVRETYATAAWLVYLGPGDTCGPCLGPW
jgi:uncharacterized protein YabN with tetrapyrrole methylase and pyrophosphatase domain